MDGSHSPYLIATLSYVAPHPARSNRGEVASGLPEKPELIQPTEHKTRKIFTIAEEGACLANDNNTVRQL